MKKLGIIFLSVIIISFCFAPFVSLAVAPINIWAERDHVFGQNYGQSHRMDGDLDGDGIQDFVVSAMNWNSLTGHVFIYWGGSSLSATPDITIEGESTLSKFGDGMSVGDFNGDTIDDLAVGAVGYSSSQGKNYVFYGRSRVAWSAVSNATQANVKVAGEVGISGHLGNKNALGDVNGDGFDDLLMGAEYYGGSAQGRAYLVYGNVSASIDINAIAVDLIINNNIASTSALGTEVDIADVTGDSKKDLLISVDSWLTGGENCRALVFAGGSFTTGIINGSAATVIISGIGVDYKTFSYPMRGVDINNDGKKDLVIGCDHFGDATSLSRMFIFYGSSSFSGSKNAADADIIILAEGLSQMFSMAIASGDINNDGIDDIITTAYSGGASGRGRVYVFFGGDSIASKTQASEADYKIDNPYPAGNGNFSWWLSAGDINNDGWDEFCGTAVKVAGTTTAAYIYSLSHIPPTVTINGPTINYANNNAEVSFGGNATDPDGGNIERVQYSLDGGSWQNATPADGFFDSSSEDYYFDMTITANGTHSVRVRATDSENATTLEENYAIFTFIVIGVLPESGQSLIDYINNLLF